ncbi:MAG: glycosyltransferase family 4 protein, partial [Bacillota bacterium]
MNVLFLTIAGFRSINEPGIYNDLLREFIKNGHQIYVVCAKQKRDNLPVGLFENDGYKILRVGIGNVTKTTNLIEKGISMLGLERKFLNGIKKHYNDVKFDLVLYATPPITFDRVVKYIKKRDLAKSYLLLKDIFPQNSVDLRMFSKRNPIYWYFRLREKQLYRNSDVIGCMSEANVEYLLKHNPELSADIVEVCPNSIEPINIDVNDKQRTDIRQKYGIPLDKTVFIYGGNLGKPQGIEFLIKCLKSNQDNEDVFFLIVGSGT